MQYYILYLFVIIVLFILTGNYLYKKHKLKKFNKRDEIELLSICSKFSSHKEKAECARVCEILSKIINVKPGQIRLSDSLNDLSSYLPLQEMFYDDLEEYIIKEENNILSSHTSGISKMTVRDFIRYRLTIKTH